MTDIFRCAASQTVASQTVEFKKCSDM